MYLVIFKVLSLKLLLEKSFLTESVVMIMCDKSNNNTQSTADYLAQLINDRKQVTAFPNVFMHVERLIDEGKSQHFPLCGC